VIPLAHFGHWYVQIIFAAPVLVLAVLMTVDTMRARRRRRDEEKPPSTRPDR
jgi:membrane protein implicated in regulation of membrane protease activity